MSELTSGADSTHSVPDGSAGKHDPVPAIIDWAVGALVALIGLAMTAGGLVGYQQVDRAEITDAVTSDDGEFGGLTETELVDAAVPLVDWLMAGIVVAGLMAIVGAGAFVWFRRRTRQQVEREGGTTATFWACAVYGSIAGALTPIPLVSMGVGGGVAAYLHGDNSSRVGAAAGVVAGILSLPVLLFTVAGLLAAGAAIGELGGGMFLAGIIVTVQIVGLAFNAGVGAVGGILAARFA